MTGGPSPSSPPRVSVLLPVRDGEAYLGEAIESVLSQSLRDLELIAVDDGSSDGTPAILASFRERDPRVRILTTPGRGIVAALELARDEARGEFLARMDADDISLPERLRLQLDLMEAEPEVVCCGVGVRYFPRAEVRDGALRYEDWINSSRTAAEIERDLLVECPIAHPTFFLRATAVEAAGGYRDRGWAEDYDLLLRLWRRGGEFARVPEVLLLWREGSSRLSRTDPRYSPQAFRACKVHHLRAGLLGAGPGERGRDVVICGAGPVGKALARLLLAAGTRVRAFVDLDPRKIGQTIHGAPVVGPQEVAGLLDRGGGLVALGAVGQVGARGRIRTLFETAGWREGQDLWMVA